MIVCNVIDYICVANPYSFASCIVSAICEALYIIFFGTHPNKDAIIYKYKIRWIYLPTLTHVPPYAPPSNTATFAPYPTALSAHETPPDPAPITIRS